MNTILQCLSNCASLRNYFLNNDYYYKAGNNSNDKGIIITRSFVLLLKKLWYESHELCSPEILNTIIINMINGQHKYIDEYLLFLLNNLHDELRFNKLNEEHATVCGIPNKQINNFEQSIIKTVFYSNVETKFTCLKCGYESTSQENKCHLFKIPLFNFWNIKIYFIIPHSDFKLYYFTITLYKRTYASLRKKISEYLQIDYLSFIICKNKNDKLTIITDNNKTISRYTTQLICFQISSRMFYSKLNTQLNDNEYNQQQQQIKPNYELYKNKFSDQSIQNLLEESEICKDECEYKWFDDNKAKYYKVILSARSFDEKYYSFYIVLPIDINDNDLYYELFHMFIYIILKHKKYSNEIIETILHNESDNTKEQNDFIRNLFNESFNVPKALFPFELFIHHNKEHNHIEFNSNISSLYKYFQCEYELLHGIEIVFNEQYISILQTILQETPLFNCDNNSKLSIQLQQCMKYWECSIKKGNECLHC